MIGYHTKQCLRFVKQDMYLTMALVTQINVKQRVKAE